VAAGQGDSGVVSFRAVSGRRGNRWLRVVLCLALRVHRSGRVTIPDWLADWCHRTGQECRDGSGIGVFHGTSK
jgi:hypothetical protein